MKRQEAQDKLNHYAAIHGAWILELSPAEALRTAADYAQLARQEPVRQNALPHAVNAVQFESISQCLKVIAEAA